MKILPLVIVTIFFLSISLFFRGQQVLLYCFLSCFSFSFGMSVSCYKTHTLNTNMLKESINNVWVTGKIEHIYPLEKGNRVILKNIRFYSKHSKLDHNLKRIQVTIKTKNNDYQTGDYIKFFASIHPVSESLFPGKYNFRRHAFFSGIGANGFAMSRVFIIKRGVNLTIKDKIERLRWKFFSNIYDSSNKNSAVAAALIIGEQKAIDKEIIDNMRKSGLTHILSVSGMHLSMLSIICFFIVRYILSHFVFFSQRFNNKKIAAYISLFVTFAYLLISGMQVAAVRSFIMITFIIIAVILDRESDAKRSVCFAALFILIINPEYIFHPSFQMSFSAVIGLAASYEITQKLQKNNRNNSILGKIISYFIGAGISSIIAGSATAIFIIYHFGNYSNYSLIANLLVAPVTSFIIMPAILLTLLLLPFNIPKIGLLILDFGVDKMLKIAKYVSNINYSMIVFPSISPEILMIFVVGFLWICLWQAKWRFIAIIPLVVSIFYVFNAKFPDIIIDRKYNIAFIKDGDSLIQLGKKKFLSRWHKEQWLNITGSKSIKTMHLDEVYQYHHLSYILNFEFQNNTKNELLFESLKIDNRGKNLIINNRDLKDNGTYLIYLHHDNNIRVRYAADHDAHRLWSDTL